MCGNDARMSEEAAMAQAIMDGLVPTLEDGAEQSKGGSREDREEDIAARILDGEITDVDKIDTSESVNSTFASKALRRASQQKTVSPEEAEMARKILNGELP